MRPRMEKAIQVPIESGPRDIARTVAFLGGAPDVFSNALGINFERVKDQLGDVEAAEILTNSGVYAVLQFDPRSPAHGVEVLLGLKSRDLAGDLDSVLEAIRAANAPIIWRLPEAI
jgi:hypothetical protein